MTKDADLGDVSGEVAKARQPRDWSVSITDLSESRAKKLAVEVRELDAELYPAVLSPYELYQVTFDRATAEWLLAALLESDSEVESLVDGTPIIVSPRGARVAMEGVIGGLRDFLSQN